MEPSAFFDALADVPNLRSVAFTDVEMTDHGDELRFDGYAAVFGEVADLGDFTEEVDRGAFRKVLAGKPNVPLLHEHHPHQLLATTRSGRLQLEEDTKGLRTRANIAKTDLSLRVRALVDSGDITGMSYGFVAGRDNQTIENRSGRPHRRLQNFKRLLDVSTTWDPAFVSTEAQFRSQAVQFVNDPESWQQLLMGAYPQLGETGHDDDGRDDEETRSTEGEMEGDESGVTAVRSVAARKRALTLYLIEHGGGLDDASS